MNRASVRALKAEIAEVVLPQLAARLNVRAATATAGSSPTSAYSLRGAARNAGVALGVVPGRGHGQDKLAVRVQDRRILSNRRLSNLLMGELSARSKDEVDVRYIGPVRIGSGSRPWQQCVNRPLRPGCSIAHRSGTAGTLGSFFTRHGYPSKLYALSNNHVLANENQAAIGDPILQPGPADGGDAASSRVGTLADFVPLVYGSETSGNAVDCGICEVDAGIDVSMEVAGHGRWMEGIRDEPLDQGEPVLKIGRTTERTEGVVRAIEIDDVWVEYGSGFRRFDGQIELEGNGLGPFAIGGDSGSLVVDSARKACALIFATSLEGGHNGIGLAYANPIDIVLEKLALRPTDWPGLAGEGR